MLPFFSNIHASSVSKCLLNDVYHAYTRKVTQNAILTQQSCLVHLSVLHSSELSERG